MKTLTVQTLAQWRKWLNRNHAAESEVWLIFHKRHTGRKSIAYADALDEALCYGWIDSLVKRLDEDRFARKFTPRNPDSRWSEVNRKHYARLKAAGRMMPAGLDRPPTNRGYNKPSPSSWELRPYIRAAFQENPRVWDNFQKLSPRNQRHYFGWIDSAKKEETKRKRLQEAIGLLAQGKTLGLK